MTSEPLISLQNIKHSFILRDESVSALWLKSFQLKRGERLAIHGPNGSGKTTLLHMIAGLLRPTEGIVKINDVEIYTLTQRARDSYRAKSVGYLFQSFYLIESLSALENVLCAATLAGSFSRREGLKRATGLLTRFGLQERLDHRPSQLSLGQQQRVAAVRALINDPQIVLCDEPTASLDTESAHLLLNELDLHCTEKGATLLVASHDPEVLALFPVLELAPPAQREA